MGKIIRAAIPPPELTPRVISMDRQICYCFGYRVSDLEQDLVTHGSSTIMAKVLAEKQAGHCQCAAKNPHGR